MLYVECYPDEVLVRILGVSRREVGHEKGKGNITNRLRDAVSGMGMVDEDPQGFQPRELRNYRREQANGQLVLLRHAQSPAKRLITISPRLEEWLYNRAAAHAINPREFSLPATAKELHDLPRYDQKPGYLEFLRRLLAVDTEMQCLRSWIRG